MNQTDALNSAYHKEILILPLHMYVPRVHFLQLSARTLPALLSEQLMSQNTLKCHVQFSVLTRVWLY